MLEMSKRLLLYIASDCDTFLKSTSESADRENTYELRGNINKVGAERFRCTELTTNLYRASWSGVMSFNDTDALQEIGERMMKYRNAGFFPATVSVAVSLGAKIAQAEREC